MKRYTWVIYLLLSIFIIGGLGFWWFWSLGSIADTADPQMQLYIAQGSVFVTADEQGSEQQAQDGMLLNPGDVVRTEAAALASIVVPGRTEVRLDGDTSLRVEEIQPSWSQAFIMRWQLESGRAWTRIMRLIDLDSTVSGQTNSVVATVRGTAFALTKQGAPSEVYVDHAGVVVGHQSDVLKYLTAEDWMRFGPEGELLDQGGSASNTWSHKDWVEQNQGKDRDFELQAEQDLLASFQDRSGTAPDHWAYTLSRWSEQMHLSLAGDQCSAQFAKYIGRHIGYVNDLVMRGKSGLAYHHLGWIEQEIQIRQEQGTCAELNPLRDIIGRALLSVAGINPEDPLYRLKLRLEDLYANLWDTDSAPAIYARSLSVDARLDEAERFDCMPEVRESFEKAIEAAQLAIVRQETDIEKALDRFKLNERMALQEKLRIQQQRYHRLMERLEKCMAPPVMQEPDVMMATSTTSTQLETMTTTTRKETDYSDSEGQVLEYQEPVQPEPTPEPVVIEAPPIVTEPPPEPQPEPEPETEPPPQTSLNITKIQLFIQPNPIYKDQSANLYVQGYRADGSTVDVTSQSTFQKIGSIGSISGTTFTSVQTGSVTIIANVSDAGGTYSSQASLQIIQQPVTLEQLSVSISGGLTIYQGDKRTITVTAEYSDGSTKNVTALSSLSLSDYTKGDLSGDSFFAGPNATGGVIIRANYSEFGVTQTASLSLNILPK